MTSGRCEKSDGVFYLKKFWLILDEEVQSGDTRARAAEYGEEGLFFCCFVSFYSFLLFIVFVAIFDILQDYLKFFKESVPR